MCIIMLGRSVTTFTTYRPLGTGLQRQSLSMSKSCKRRLVTTAAITDKQVVVVGANRGIGLEVRCLWWPL